MSDKELPKTSPNKCLLTIGYRMMPTGGKLHSCLMPLRRYPTLPQLELTNSKNLWMMKYCDFGVDVFLRFDIWSDSIKRTMIREHEDTSINENTMIFKQNNHCFNHIAIRGYCCNFKSSTHYIMMLEIGKIDCKKPQFKNTFIFNRK